jgi:uncharacterized protein YodC (DUF2158 family)
MSEHNFKAGDSVQLKTGGPIMTVESIDEIVYEGNVQVQCAWFDAKHKRQSDYFAPGALRKVEEQTDNTTRPLNVCIDSKRMTELSEEKLVVAFDMCSSSNVLEDLKLTGNINRLLDLFDDIGRFLNDKSRELNFCSHKFVGDGWILLFSAESSGEQVLAFLNSLCTKFAQLYERTIKPFLDNPIAISGLTFGMDVGGLSPVSISNAKEYVGRSINIACRLQSAIKDKDASPKFKALVSRQCYNRYFKDFAAACSPLETTRNLRNIRGGEDFGCVALSFTGADKVTPINTAQQSGDRATAPVIIVEPFFQTVTRGHVEDGLIKHYQHDWFHLKIRNQSPFDVSIDTIGFSASGKRIPAKFSIEDSGMNVLPYRLEARSVCVAMFWTIAVEQDDLERIDEVYVETACGNYFPCKSDLISRWKSECTKPVAE